MRIANVSGRLTLLDGDAGIDVERASNGVFSADPAAVYLRWDEFRLWVTQLEPDEKVCDATIDPHSFGPPSPQPRQVFAIGANYHDHVAEAGVAPPKTMEVFTKYPTCVVGPYAEVPLPGKRIDWEAELVVIIGRHAHHVPAELSWDYVAGVTAGQDFSCRKTQFAGSQFSLSKSFPAFGPTGPWLRTVDELPDRDNVAIQCSVNGDLVQRGSTADMIYSVPEAIARLSAIVPLLPGDLIFTGTMAGVGAFRKPPRFLAPGDEVTTEVAGMAMRNRCVPQGGATSR
ncbi:fumarylacetoacetate hydrolase family protein [Mycobacterium avium]|uniref:fumarylacetoacetate hydrolase family protein n=1 Tax=Mycobacterium avium TaxID=1764 RepID=UPI001CC52C4E|nr:fumarylacetoacetate hydrolase family protein [Mycobacterium avium]MBZ4521863.1 fumarylacetoacetate hydrolase family protein [Mycobacterium avium subsp. hominissuis]MBZ4531246.1 fumarylacetoacetate hydrolase family protein [Mycobacterium avium subsp. hominissuis]